MMAALDRRKGGQKDYWLPKVYTGRKAGLHFGEEAATAMVVTNYRLPNGLIKVR
jgi:hypothetical protein